MPTVLVVDDSPVDRSIVDGLLERQADLDWLVDYAENGVVALAKMQDLLPDVVVTDLQMPEMDGLELVSAMGARYPDVPVILITGQGSEQIALDALERGAASYVPKARLADKLMGTIKQVLATSRAEIGHRRISQCIHDAHFRMTLVNDAALIGPLINYFQELLEEMQFCDKSERVHIAIALEEAVINAMFHGNLEIPPDQVRKARSQLNEEEFGRFGEEKRSEPPYRDRHVFIEAYVTPQEVKFIIRDEGPGMQPDAIPDRGDPRTLEEREGRGFVLMKNFMDQVLYDEERNEVTLMKKAPQPVV